MMAVSLRVPRGVPPPGVVVAQWWTSRETRKKERKRREKPLSTVGKTGIRQEEVLKREMITAWTHALRQGKRKLGAASVIAKVSEGDAIVQLRVVFTALREALRKQHHAAVNALQRLGRSPRVQMRHDADAHRGMLRCASLAAYFTALPPSRSLATAMPLAPRRNNSPSLLAGDCQTQNKKQTPHSIPKTLTS